MIIYANPTFYVFLSTLAAFVLLILTVFSVPMVSTSYFLHSSQANGVSFGMWGWCLDEGDVCSPLQLGYTWEPEIAIPITKAFVFYPIAAVFTFLTMISMLPVLWVRTERSDKVFQVFAWISFAFSSLAFLFTIGMWGVAKSKFEKRGFSATYGNLTWMSLAATLLLLVVAISPYFIALPPKQPSRRRHTRRNDTEARPRRKTLA
ncbi:hypothetical protein CVT25_014524 [Psilocybe cyanescens]|uniref:Uncharacterized protein n=1 Tax=Psilocybe cyanescens TaxID=93625 RepID=A0A409WRB3_PSICY|nr:hypothetical protein CVT25_014524 [Psilocybe cyanescens]